MRMGIRSIIVSKVYTDVEGMKGIPLLSTFTGDNPLAKFADYLHVHSDKPWYDYYLFKHIESFQNFSMYRTDS